MQVIERVEQLVCPLKHFVRSKRDVALLEHIFQIIDILMKGVMKRLANLGFSLELTPDAKTFLSEKGYDQQFGARPLHRAIQKYLEDPLAEEILNLNVKPGDVLEADLDKENNKLKFSFKSRVEEKSKA